MSYQTKNYEEANFESHPNHIDIQILLSGNEKIYIKNRLLFHDISKYDSKTDTIIYVDKPSDSNMCLLSPGSILVLYPDDCHMGAVISTKSCMVKKIVGKLRLNE